jgi:hypothetical protein
MIVCVTCHFFVFALCYYIDILPYVILCTILDGYMTFAKKAPPETLMYPTKLNIKLYYPTELNVT